VSAAACNGPENLFVAGFLGESNIIASSALAQRAMPKDAAQLMVRPESITLAAADASAADAIPGKVLATDYLGTSIRYLVETSAGRLVARAPRSQRARSFAPDESVQVFWEPQDSRMFDAQGRALRN